MNYLQIINKCLLELNYRTVSSLSELVKNDHKRIVQILNVINKEICAIEGWNFLLRETEFILNSGCSEIVNPIDGRILHLFIDNEKYIFDEKFEKFFIDKSKSKTYSSINDKLLFPKFPLL